MAADLSRVRARTPPELTDKQRASFLAAVKANPALGNIAALRQAGINGQRGELRELLDADPELEEDARAARGWCLVAVEATTWKVAQDTEHPAWDRANARVLKAYHRGYRDRVDHEHHGEVTVPDLSAALERFNALASSAVGASARADTRELASGEDRG